MAEQSSSGAFLPEVRMAVTVRILEGSIKSDLTLPYHIRRYIVSKILQEVFTVLTKR